MSKHKISMLDLEDYVKGELAIRSKKIKGTRQLREKMPDCPECANQMILQPVIAVKGYENRFGWKSVLRCYSCGHEEFFLETMDDKVKQLKDTQVNK